MVVNFDFFLGCTAFFQNMRSMLNHSVGQLLSYLRKPRSHGDVYNDLDQDIFNLFRVLRDEKTAARLRELCELTLYSRDEFQLAYQHTDDPVERVRRTIVRSAMGFGSGAATGHKTGFRCEARRKHATSANVWDRYPPVLTWVAQRLRGVNN